MLLNKIILICLIGLSISTFVSAQNTLRFNFGEGTQVSNYIKITPLDTLNASASYGFHTSN
ncbi:MAG: hypothetical protein ABI091_10890, partial [Ferruginibacter sp.]